MLTKYVYNTMGHFREKHGVEDMEFPGLREVETKAISRNQSEKGWDS